MQILIVITLFAAFYFILLRPVLQQQKAQRRELADLRIGDEVLTTGNIFATVVEIETPEEGSTVIVLEMAPGLRMRALPQAILQRVPSKQSTPTENAETAGLAQD